MPDINLDLPFATASALPALANVTGAGDADYKFYGPEDAIWKAPVAAVRTHGPALIGQVGDFVRANPRLVLAANIAVAAAFVLRRSPTARHYVIGYPVAAVTIARDWIHQVTAPRPVATVTGGERGLPVPPADMIGQPAAARRKFNGADHSAMA